VVLEPGEIVEGRYRIVRPIAEGGMGTVFLAEHQLIKRRVALKVLHAELAHDTTIVRRFMNEALAAGTLGHPNIVESTDMGFTPSGVPYIVFEYLDGTALADELARVRQLPVARAVRIAHQIAGALSAAHAAGIIHRDLKSDNVFLVRRGGSGDHVKVLDFGISRFLAASDRTQVGGNLMGTPPYMAPEQVLAPDTIDHRVDVYALGVVLYELLTGHVPFAPESSGRAASYDETERLLDRIVNDKPPPITRDDVPRELARLVEERLLAKVPKWRCATMADVQRELELAILGSRWAQVDGALVCELHSKQMARFVDVLGAAASIADELAHHPHVEIAHARMRIALPAARAVDLELAMRLEAWLQDAGW